MSNAAARLLHGRLASLLRDDEWKTQAACRPGLIPEWIAEGFFLDLSRYARDRLAVEEAKAVCRTCPVQGTCHEHAVATGADGVWGGVDTREREAMIAKARRRRA